MQSRYIANIAVLVWLLLLAYPQLLVMGLAGFAGEDQKTEAAIIIIFSFKAIVTQWALYVVGVSKKRPNLLKYVVLISLVPVVLLLTVGTITWL